MDRLTLSGCTGTLNLVIRFTCTSTLQDVHLDDVLLAHHLEPAEGPGTTALLELCLRMPIGTSTASLTIDFQKAFLTVFDHPPDAHRGFDIPAALFTFLDARPEHQVLFHFSTCCME